MGHHMQMSSVATGVDTIESTSKAAIFPRELLSLVWKSLVILGELSTPPGG